MMTCEMCGKEYERTGYGQKFCSKRCRARHGNFRRDAGVLDSSHYGAGIVTERAPEPPRFWEQLDKGTCEDCGSHDRWLYREVGINTVKLCGECVQTIEMEKVRAA